MTIDNRHRTLLFAVLGAVCAACGGEAAPEAGADEAAATTDGAAAAPAQGPAALLNPNLATEEELAGLAQEGVPAAAIAVLRDGRPFLDMLAVDAALAPHMGFGPRSALYNSLWVPLDLNRATREEILLIPNLGDRMAHEFEEYRPYDGMPRFRREIGKYVDEDEVDRLARYVFVPIDLNTATDDQILAIPGVGDRLLHEFKEYRPYTSMEQFMREIGKYVDENELARLARYVTLAVN